MILKVKVSDFNPESLERIKAVQLSKLKALKASGKTLNDMLSVRSFPQKFVREHFNNL